MKCPTDGATLVMSERSGIEIDYCPDCRGVWLDRGELDKILDRAVAESASAAPQPAAAPPQQPQYAPPPQQYEQPRYAPQPQYYKKKKREHWLSELFD